MVVVVVSGGSGSGSSSSDNNNNAFIQILTTIVVKIQGKEHFFVLLIWHMLITISWQMVFFLTHRIF
jgi:hypothetical protein